VRRNKARGFPAATFACSGPPVGRQAGYRDPRDIEAAIAADPLALAKSRLIDVIA
jgi:hypothetical protein